MTFTRFFCTATAALVLTVAGRAQSGAEELTITEMAVTTKVVKGAPIDSVWRISSSSVKTLYCFTRFQAPKGTDTSVKHVWYLNDQVAAEDELPVKGSRWRAYSTMPVKPGVAGAGRCDVQDEDGKVLKSVSFRIN